MDTKTISVVSITEKTRCYLYFDVIRDTEKPVINLRVDVAITGSGTGTDLFVVN